VGRGIALLTAVILTACSSQIHQAPGDILQSSALPGAPAEAAATRIVYASTAPDGSPIAVSGLVIVPATPAPRDGRPIVAWLHATTGVGRACAPSDGPAPFGQIQGLGAFLAAGYVVVATDYPGLGGPGVHPYLVGASEARAALDSVRAVLRLPGTQASSRFAVWGHSQGGHAALFTAELARSYAPELRPVGTAAAAPVTDVAALIEKPGDDRLWGALVFYLVFSWSRVSGADRDGLVPAADPAVIDRVASDCLETASELRRLLSDAAPLHGTPVTPNAHWRSLLADNAPRPAQDDPPVFLAQGDDDPVIPPPLTKAFARRLCENGVSVRYFAMPGVDHYRAAMRSADEAAAWIAGRFAGTVAPDDCAALQRQGRASR
jgi:acetyl esterase/lipase